MLDIFENIQGFPMLNGVKWNESNWDWEQSLLNLRQFISNKNDNIFRSKKNNGELMIDINVRNSICN